MRQRRWMKYLEDYDFTLYYHPGKAMWWLMHSAGSHWECVASREWQMLEDVGQFGLHYMG